MGRFVGLRMVRAGRGNGRRIQAGAMVLACAASCTALGLMLAGCGAAAGRPLSAGEAGADPAYLQSVLQDEFSRLGIDPNRVLATAPDTTYSAVVDLQAVRKPGSTWYEIELRWTEQACGDYDQNGTVGVADLTPLAVHWAKQVEYSGSAPAGDPADDGGEGAGVPPPAGSGAANWRLARIDGNHDGVLNIGDVTPIAVNWNKRLDGYRVYQRLSGTTDWLLLGDIASRPGIDATRPVRYTYNATPGAPGYYEFKVIPYDADGDDEGTESNTAAISITPGDVWQMYGHDAQHTFCSSHIGPAAPLLKWKLDTHQPLASLPVYACTSERNGILSYIYDEKCYSLDSAGNTLLISAAGVHEFGPALLADGSAVSVSYGNPGENKYLTAVTPAGAQRWSTALPFDRYFQPVAGPDDRVYLAKAADSTSDNSHEVITFDGNGQQLYTASVTGSIITPLTPGAAGDAYFGYRAENVVTLEMDYSVSKLDNLGQVAWNCKLLMTPPETDTGLTQPVLRQDGVVLAVAGNSLAAVSSDGGLLWTLAVAENDPVADGEVFLAADNANNAYVMYSTPQVRVLLQVGPGGELNWTRELDLACTGYAMVFSDAAQRVCCSFTLSPGITELRLFNADGWVLKVAQVPLAATGLFSGAEHFYLVSNGGITAVDFELAQAWTKGISNYFWSSASVAADNSLFITDARNVLSKLTETGAVAWSKSVNAGNTYSCRPVPAADLSGVVYLSGVEGHGLCAVNPDGSYKWVHDDATENSSSPAIGPDGMIYIPGHTQEIPNAALLCASTGGTVLWGGLKPPGFSGVGCPAVSPQGLAYLSDYSTLISYSREGTELWNTTSGLLGTFDSHAAIATDGTIYFPQYNNLKAITPDNNLLWTYSVGEVTAPDCYIAHGAAVYTDGSVVFATGDGRVIRLSPAGGELWTYQAPAGFSATPVIDRAGTVYAGCDDGKLRAIGADGLLRWEYQAGGPVTASPSIGSDGSILFGADDGCFYALGPGQE